MTFPKYVENLIANLRGIPEEKHISYQRPAQSIDNLIDQILKRYESPEAQLAGTIMKNWREIVGTPYAHRCTVQKIKNNYIYIRVENATLRMELEFQKQAILQKIKDVSEYEKFCGVILIST